MHIGQCSGGYKAFRLFFLPCWLKIACSAQIHHTIKQPKDYGINPQAFAHKSIYSVSFWLLSHTSYLSPLFQKTASIKATRRVVFGGPDGAGWLFFVRPRRQAASSAPRAPC